MELVRQLDSYIVEEIESAEQKLNIHLSEYSKLYLLHLLKRLSQSDDFFYSDIVRDKPLGIVLLEALHKDIFEKIRDLRIVGDLSLVFSGLYPDFLTRRLVDIDYFIALGRKSYYLLSDTYSNHRAKREVFILYSQLVAEFLCLVNVLTEMSDEMNFLDDSNVEKAYTRWQKTGVKKYEEILSESNVIPI